MAETLRPVDEHVARRRRLRGHRGLWPREWEAWRNASRERRKLRTVLNGNSIPSTLSMSLDRSPTVSQPSLRVRGDSKTILTGSGPCAIGLLTLDEVDPQHERSPPCCPSLARRQTEDHLKQRRIRAPPRHMRKPLGFRGKRRRCLAPPLESVELHRKRGAAIAAGAGAM